MPVNGEKKIQSGQKKSRKGTGKKDTKGVKRMEKKQMLDAQDLQSNEYGFSRVRAYQILNDKTLPVIRLGRRLFVRRSDFEKWLDSKQVNAGERMAV